MAAARFEDGSVGCEHWKMLLEMCDDLVGGGEKREGVDKEGEGKLLLPTHEQCEAVAKRFRAKITYSHMTPYVPRYACQKSPAIPAKKPRETQRRWPDIGAPQHPHRHRTRNDALHISRGRCHGGN